VERAADAVVLDPAAHGQVGAEVRAVGVHEPGPAVGGAVEHQVAVEVAQRPHVAGGELGRGRHHEPAVGDAERVAGLVEAGDPLPAAEVAQQAGIPGHRQPGGKPPVGCVGGCRCQLPEGNVVSHVGHG
jgi:hypothetical protein